MYQDESKGAQSGGFRIVIFGHSLEGRFTRQGKDKKETQLALDAGNEGKGRDHQREKERGRAEKMIDSPDLLRCEVRNKLTNIPRRIPKRTYDRRIENAKEGARQTRNRARLGNL